MSKPFGGLRFICYTCIVIHNDMKGTLIIRELTKTVLIVFYWLFPIWMWRTSQNGAYLWFFILSFLLTLSTFAHYESLLEKTDEPEVKPRRVTVEDLYPKNDERES